MKTMKRIILHSAFCITALGSSVQAKIVEFTEDNGAIQAPENLVVVAEKAAALVGFDTPYEIVVPKKMGIEINPWNKFVAYAINPLTKNPLIVINSEWFAKMPEEQQLFLLARNFLTFKQGRPFSMKVIPYLFILLSICLGMFFFWVLGKTALKNQKTWIRVIIAIVLAGACEPLFTDRLEAAVLRSLGRRFDLNILELVVEKTKDRDAAIKALKFYDSSIKNEFSNDEAFWTPYKNLFGEYAQELKKK